MLLVPATSEKLGKREMDAMLAILRRGGVVAYPTDTAYGLAVDPRVRGATKRIFAIKGRKENKPLSVIVASGTMAKRYGVFSPLATQLAKRYWPGALMLVVPLRKTKEAQALRSLRGGNSVGLRYPDHPIAVALARRLGYPVTSTSANRSGKQACYRLEEFLGQFGLRSSLRGEISRPSLRAKTPPRRGRSEAISSLGTGSAISQNARDCHEPTAVGSRNDIRRLPDLFLDAGPLPKRPTSTVVDCTGKEPKILRQGRIRFTNFTPSS